jgi:uncharacterized repeat protein (TIGR02543 family)
MLVEGIVYVGGVRAEDGTPVEARIDDQTVASFQTVTSDGRQGYYILRIDAEEGDEIAFFVDGEAVKVLVEGETQTVMAFESGYHAADLIVGGSPPTVTLTMAVNGNGQTVPAVGEHSYPEGSEVRIGAVPDVGYQFDGWSGEVGDPNSPATRITLDSDQTVTANFSLAPTSTPEPTPLPTSTGKPQPSATPTPTGEESPTPSPTPTPEASATPGPSATPQEATEAATTGPSATATEGAESAESSTSEPSAVPSEAGGAATTEPSASPGPSTTPSDVGQGETAGPSPTSGVGDGDTPAPASPASTSSEEEGGSERGSGLIIAAVALAALGAVAVGFGIYGLRRVG